MGRKRRLCVHQRQHAVQHVSAAQVYLTPQEEFTYRGLSVEELKALPMFAPDDDPDALSVEAIMPARARRKYVRGYAVGIENGGSNIEEEHFINRLRENPGKTIKTHCRSSTSYQRWLAERLAFTMDALSRWSRFCLR